MANANQFLAAIRQKYPLVQVDDALLNELRRREGEGASLEQVLADSAGYYQTRRTPLDIFEPVRKAGAEGFAKRKAQNAADFTDVSTRLREEATRSGSALEERQNQLGLLRSGQTSTGLGKIASDLSNNIGRADIQRAIADADLALKEAGFNADLSSQTLNLSNQLNRDQTGNALNSSKFVTDLLQSPSIDSIPDNILRQILEQLGYTVTD